MWYFSKNLHFLSFTFSFVSLHHYWRFGTTQTIERFLNYFNTYFDNLIIGKILGLEVLGVYDLAKRLLIQPIYVLNPLITKISFPILAQVQNETNRFRNIALRSIQLAATINAPIYCACIIGATYIVPIIYGEKWLSSVEPFRWMAVCFLFRALINPLGGILLAKGKMQYGIYFQLTISVALLFTVGLGVLNGLTFMIILLSLTYFIIFLGFYYFAIKPLTKMKFIELVRYLWIELLTGFISYILAFAIIKIFFQVPSWASLIVFLVCGTTFFIILLLLLRPHLIEEVKQIIKK
jgi:O-antigen/teichoic acid export membrane protein